MEYAIAKRHPLIGQQLEMVQCERLPEVNSFENQGCIKLGIPQPEPVNEGFRIVLFLNK